MRRVDRALCAVTAYGSCINRDSVRVLIPCSRRERVADAV